MQDDRAELGDEQQLAVGVDEVAVVAWVVGGVQVDGHAVAGLDVAVARDREQAVDEVLRRVFPRQRKRVPAQPVRVGSSSSNGVPFRCPLSILRNAGCFALGSTRYTQDRRFTPRGWVNAVPLSCSAYRPRGARCGELRPAGSAPATASVANSFPNPLE